MIARHLGICLAAIVIAAALCPNAWAQTGTQQAVRRAQILEEIVQHGATTAVRKVNMRPFETPIGIGADEHLIAYLIALHKERAGYEALLKAMEARADKQIGAPAGNGRGTSIVSKGLVPQVLGFAVESGALSRDVDGTTLTFRATPMGVIKALQGRGLLELYADYGSSEGARLASRFSVAAIFDASRGGTGGAFTAARQQWSGWSVRYVVHNGRDPARREYAELWRGILRTSQPYLQAVKEIGPALASWPEFAAWRTRLVRLVADQVDREWNETGDVEAAAGRFRSILAAELPKLGEVGAPPAAITRALDNFVVTLTAVQASIDSVYDFAGKGSLLTAEWLTTRDDALPDLYTLTGVWEAALGRTRRTDLAVNGAVSFFRTTPVQAARQFKSFELSAQLEHPLGAVAALPPLTLAFAGRYAYLPDDTAASMLAPAPGGSAVGAATAAVAPKGQIFVAQVKLVVPVKGAGVKIPLSVTASNRTELIKEKDVRASFGLTLDLDSLVGLFAPR